MAEWARNNSRNEHLQEPWKAENAGDVLGKAYPERIWAVRRGAEFRAEASAVAAKHGSRKGNARKRASRAQTANPNQMSLALGDAP
jgi:deoxyribodipyrimidine photo-lyase